MIRVMYRWRVEPDAEAQFVEAWRAATTRIRDQQPGAMGSTLVRPSDAPSTLVGLARWRHRDDVEAFWAAGIASPLPGGSLDSIEVFEEIEHMTLES
jgi:heme-degrading monooxygenase HmoA